MGTYPNKATMKTTSNFLKAGLMIVALAVFGLAGCEDVTEITIYDPDDTGGAAPTITALTPAGSYFAGFETITITGTNFSANAAENFVYFDGVQAQVQSASANQLVVRTPNLVKENIAVKVATSQSVTHSNTISYNLTTLINRVGNLLAFETPWAIAADSDNNLYVSYTTTNSVPDGVIKIAPDGSKTRYANPQTWRYTNMAFGPDGYLYAVRGNTPIVYRVAPGGGAFATHVSGSGLSRNLYAITFDADGNIWVGGNNTSFHRISPQRQVTSFAFSENITAMKFMNGAVFAATVNTSGAAPKSVVYRIPINGGTAGTPTVYFDVDQATNTTGIQVSALETDVNGNLYLGTDRPGMSILKVGPTSWSNFYPGIVDPVVLNFAWGGGQEVFITRGVLGTSRQDLFRLNMQTTKGE